MKQFFTVLYTLVVVAAVVNAKDDPQKILNRLPKGTIIERDIVYAKNGEREMLLDVYRHKSEKPLPLVINAQSLMGSHFEYPENLFATELGHEKTPTDQLLLCWIFPRQSNPFQAKQTEPRESTNLPEGEEQKRSLRKLQSPFAPPSRVRSPPMVLCASLP